MSDAVNEIKEKWPDILAYLKNEYDISDISFNTWILPLEITAVEDHTIILMVPEESIGLSYIKKKYYLPIKSLLLRFLEETTISSLFFPIR